MKIKEIKIINQDQSTEVADIGANAENVDYGTTNVKLKLDELSNSTDTNKANISKETNIRTTEVGNLQNQINSLASGSPKGSYANAAAIVSANPATGVYIAQDNGHIYSWTKNASSAIDLGVYQATAIEENAITLKNIDNSNFGTFFKATPTSISNSMICRFSLAASKRFNSKSSTIRIAGTYHCNSKTNTWFHVNFKVGGSNYGQQTTVIIVDNAQNYKKDVEFNKVINGFGISATVTSICFIVDGGGSATLDHYIKDLKIWINDELYNYGTDYVFDSTNYEYCTEEKIDKDFLVGKSQIKLIENAVNDQETRITNLENNPIKEKSIDSAFLSDSIKGKQYNYNTTAEDATYPLWFSFRIKEVNKRPLAKDVKTIRLNYTINKLDTNFTNAILAVQIGGSNYGVVSHSRYNDSEVVISDNKYKANTDYTFIGLTTSFGRTESVSITSIAVGIDTNNKRDFNFYIKDLEVWINDTLYSDSDLEFVPTVRTSVEYTDLTWPLASKNYVDTKTNQIETKLSTIEETVLKLPVEDLLRVKDYDVMTKSDLYNIVCWGDSLTAGAYPGELQSWINNENVHVTNKGVSGEASGTIAFRQGGNIILATEDFEIPATTDPVLFTFSVSAGGVPNLARIHTKAKINNIKGVITIETREADSQRCIQFVRDEAGTAVSVDSGTRVEPIDAEQYRDNLAIIWVGRNDMAFSWPTQITGTLDNIKKMIEYLTPTIKRFLVLPILNSTGETSESTADARGWILTIESQLKELYPNNFVDIRRYIIDQCIYDMGLTPTTEDLNNMALDAPPPSIMADGVHPSGEARKYIAKEIYRVMKTKDWIR